MGNGVGRYASVVSRTVMVEMLHPADVGTRGLTTPVHAAWLLRSGLAQDLQHGGGDVCPLQGGHESAQGVGVGDLERADRGCR